MALARRFGIGFMEVSAKEGVNVGEGFEMMVGEIHKKRESRGEIEGLVSRREIMIGRRAVVGDE